MIYDLAIIGGGPAGYSAALEAVKYGLSVVIFEKELLGGTCLNKGCVPTKFLAHVAELYDDRNYYGKYGIYNTGDIGIDHAVTKQEMDKTVNQLRNSLEQLLVSKGVIVVKGEAVVKSEKKIYCGTQQYEADNILIATGSKQAEPIIEGTMSSDDILGMEKLPESVLIVGGGVVAIEFAYILNKLGCKITIAIRGERILRKWDKELAVSISQLLKKSGISILTGCTYEDFCKEDYDVVLSAVGRVARRDGTERLPLGLDEKNAICVDNIYQTNIPHIYAAGDVISESPMLAHIAMEQGRNVARIIAGKENSSSVVAECIYISPEVASVGMTEAKAKAAGIDYVSGKINMASNARTLITTDDRCFIKVIVDRHSHVIMGAQLMCERASDIASEFVVGINNRMTVEKLKESVHPHPSYSEAIIDVLDVLTGKFDEI